MESEYNHLMAVTTARHKVLNYLYKTRTATAREISRGLKFSAATVRHHLRLLVSDGRLEITSGRVRERRGRPEKVYSIPQAALGDNLTVLADALWTEGGKSISVSGLAKYLAGESDFKSQPVTKRLGLVMEKLNRMKYHARWEAGAGGPRIIFGHCPYAAILAKHPELCRMDMALLEELMGGSADQVMTIREGGSTCVFAMRR